MALPSNTQARFKSPAREDLLFYHLHGAEEIGKPFLYDVTFFSTDGALSPPDLLGKPISIELDLPSSSLLPNGGQRYFHGYVARLARQGRHRNFHVYTASVRPWLWLLSRAKDCRIFQNKTAPEIIKEVFRKHGLTDFEEHLVEPYARHEFVVQYHETDLDFVSRLMAQEGMFYFFRHEAIKHVLVLADSFSAYKKVPGYEQVLFDTRQNEGFDLVERLDDWHAQQEIRSGSVVLEDFNFEKPKADLLSKRTDPNDHDKADLEVYEYPGKYVDQADGEALAKLRLEEINALQDVRTGGGSVRGLAAGSIFNLVPPWQYPEFKSAVTAVAAMTGASVELTLPPDDFREYLVVSMNFDIQGSNYESQAQPNQEEVFHCTLTAIDSQHPFRMQRSESKPTILGPQTATVVGKSGEEIWTDKYGRVKVRFHWDRDGKRDENSSCWVRVAQVWAGGRFGGINVPRIGDEVVVSFLDGDPDRPLITGRLYNADNMPPYDLPANQTQTGIKSRSTKAGDATNFNEIRFEDKKGKEELHMQAERDMSTHVKHDQSLTVDVNRTIAVGADETTTVHGKRTTTVKKDDRKTVHGSETTTVDLNRALIITGESNTDVSKKATLTFSSDRETAVKGIDETTVGKKVLKQGGTRLEYADGNVDLKTQGWLRITHAGARVHIDDDGNVTIETDKELKLIAEGASATFADGRAEISAEKEATIAVGGNTIKVDATGITTSGNNITSSATGLHQMTAPLITQN